MTMPVTGSARLRWLSDARRVEGNHFAPRDRAISRAADFHCLHGTNDRRILKNTAFSGDFPPSITDFSGHGNRPKKAGHLYRLYQINRLYDLFCIKRYFEDESCVILELDLPDGIVNRRRCDCSICRFTGAIVASLSLSGIRIARGEDVLRLYQFNTKTTKHYFCSPETVQGGLLVRPRLRT